MPLKTNAKTKILNGLPARLRVFRKVAGLTLADVAEALGVTYQQVQKYEAGINQIPLSALPALCDLLGVPVDQLLFGGSFELDPSNDKNAHRLINAYGRMRQQHMRRKMADIAEILAG